MSRFIDGVAKRLVLGHPQLHMDVAIGGMEVSRSFGTGNKNQ